MGRDESCCTPAGHPSPYHLARHPPPRHPPPPHPPTHLATKHHHLPYHHSTIRSTSTTSNPPLANFELKDRAPYEQG